MKLREKIELIQSSSSKEILNGAAINGTPLLKYVFEVHEEVFGTACKTCSSLLPGYIQKITNINLKNEIMSQKERKYRMKSGSVIHQRGTSNYYSDLNITDEIAEKLLKVNPNRAALFAKIPEGALERLAKEAAEEKAQAKAEADKKAKADADQKKKAAAEKAQKDTTKLKKVEDQKTDAPDKTDTPAKDVEVNNSEEVKSDDVPSEDAPSEKAAEEKAQSEKTDEELTFTELREKYPDIKARSKEGFLKDLEESRK